MTLSRIDCFVATISRAENPITRPVSKLGGRPVFVAELEAPRCRHCQQPMAFLAQIRLDAPLPLSRRFQMAYIFQCAGYYDDERRCPTWGAADGANRVLLQAERGRSLIPDEPAHHPEYALALTPAQDLDIDTSDFVVNTEELLLQVSDATKIGGVPAWIQNNETPRCPMCGKPMRFVAQIDDSPDGFLPGDSSQWPNYHSFGFGDAGLGYVFICDDECSVEGAFLWQCT